MSVEDKNKVPAEPIENPADDQKKPNDIEAIAAKNLELLNELKKAKATAKTFEDKLSKIEQAKKVEQGEFSELYEQTKKELEATRAEKEGLENRILDSRKLSAVVEKLGRGLKRKEYATFIDTSKIVYDEDSKTFDTRSIENVANSFLKEHSDLLITKTVKLPGDDPLSNSESISYDEWLEMPLKERKEKRKFVRKDRG